MPKTKEDLKAEIKDIQEDLNYIFSRVESIPDAEISDIDDLINKRTYGSSYGEDGVLKQIEDLDKRLDNLISDVDELEDANDKHGN